MTGNPDHKQDEEGLKDSIVRFQSYLHGGTSSLLSTLPTLIVFPVYKTVFRQQIHNTPVHQAVGQLYKEGPAKLYRGVAPPLLMRTLNGTLLFGLQDTLLLQLSHSSQNVISTAALPALAGFGAGIVEAVIFTPFERVQNVLQNGKNDHHLPTLKSVLVRLKDQRLALGYYRAFLPVTARNALGSSLYFGLKGPMCAVVAGQGLSPMISSFISGTMTSMAISLALYPLSVLVANMQAQTHLTCTGRCYSAPVHQKSSKMGDNPVKGEVENFNRSSLKKTKTDEKQYKPTADDIEQEKKETKEEKK
ncbi:Solute carrier family 25 member 53 Mitochondrial carrier triple repeat protein 6 [Larimichthys crocea]|uniref:Solute carrier family 25 member 53 Mitochondrial carrier triple repeat protein 6 n=1 Tax=Larimichthys crocea TaxID=215358 RepID=A0A6G0I445_LARCR|nr:Solute carrier family 25 member 53 Mitochondrial carrier triple repeat protein 6 [Larimichthys crocea]